MDLTVLLAFHFGTDYVPIWDGLRKGAVGAYWRAVTKAGFRLLLAALGLLMEQGSRRSRRFRSQLTRDLVVELSSADGVAHHYVFVVEGRSVSSRRGPAPQAAVGVCFESAALGLGVLLSPRAIGRTVQAALERRATIAGNAVLLLWFYGLTRMVFPVGRQKPLRRPLPGALAAPDPSSGVAGRIPRLPAEAGLDPWWEGAVGQRAKMAMLRGVAGELDDKAVMGL
jgi:hypothetical protein